MKLLLTDYMVKNAKSKEKSYIISDGGGLYLQISPNGSKYWILRIYVSGKEIRRSLGTYPEISLKAARNKAFQIKQQRNHDFDSDKLTFGEVYQKYYEFHYVNLSESYLKVINLRWENYIKPNFDRIKLREITPSMIASLCKNIDRHGYHETAKRVMLMMSAVYDYAIAEGFIDTNPAISIGKVLQNRTAVSHAALTNEKEISLLMRNIYAYDKDLVRFAMIFSAMTFCRPGEIRHAEWREIDMKNALWTIGADKMKMRREHVVPLSSQCLELLAELRHMTGGSRWLFPSARSETRSMSKGAVRVALRSMGYSNNQMTPHGFRSMASTILNSYDWPRDYIERQLAHIDSSVRGVYNRAQYLPQRRLMMQWWSDYLDAKRNDIKVPPIPEFRIAEFL